MLTVFLIDPDPDARVFYPTMLRFLGIEVQTFENGRAGLAEAERFHPDLVVIDLQLPAPSGHEVARRLKATEGMRGIKLVALSSHDYPGARAAASSAGFDSFIVRPCSPTEFATVICGALQPPEAS